MAKDLAIILNNGSVNSLVTTALAAQKHRTVMLHVEVGQEAGSRLRAAYDQQVSHFKPYREHTAAMPFLSAIGQTKPRGSADLRGTPGVGPQLVDLLPLIGAAMPFASHYQSAAVYLGLRVGVKSDELAQATEYVQIWNELMQVSCNMPELEIIMPLLDLDPWQVIDLGCQVTAPFDRTWSCSEEGSEPCWACNGCRAREAAFQQAGKPDPLRTVRKI